jgi:hypothetical protein
MQNNKMNIQTVLEKTEKELQKVENDLMELDYSDETFEVQTRLFNAFLEINQALDEYKNIIKS